MNNNQRSSFKISFAIIDDCPGEVKSYLRLINFLPLRIKPLFEMKVLHYFGISPKFKEINEGDMTPEYKLKVKTDEYGYAESVKVELIK